ncbi:hypothetical protein AB0B27_06595 [Micromonospora rifamycinica]|uniref:hypothetical protein n=1 Tax=Micromonospora rifamycinica TaxID=291594 RepID=UPI0033FCDA22
MSDPTGQCAIVRTAIIGGIVGGAVGGVDCWLSGDDRNTCIKKVVVGAAAGALTGATMGMAGGAGTGLYGGLAAGSQSGVRQVATSAIVGGSGSALYGSQWRLDGPAVQLRLRRRRAGLPLGSGVRRRGRLPG